MKPSRHRLVYRLHGSLRLLLFAGVLVCSLASAPVYNGIVAAAVAFGVFHLVVSAIHAMLWRKDMLLLGSEVLVSAVLLVDNVGRLLGSFRLLV